MHELRFHQRLQLEIQGPYLAQFLCQIRQIS
jgi:hypothetical protein